MAPISDPMHLQASQERAGPSQRESPLWLFAVLMLALVLAASLTKAQAAELTYPVYPANQAASTSHELTPGDVSSGIWRATPSDLPHCHHGHGHHFVVALPRVEQQDIEFDTLHEPVHRTDSTPPIIASTGSPHALPDPSPVSVYLLTQRFRT